MYFGRVVEKGLCRTIIRQNLVDCQLLARQNYGCCQVVILSRAQRKQRISAMRQETLRLYCVPLRVTVAACQETWQQSYAKMRVTRLHN